MGCHCCKSPKETQEVTKPEYSWEKRGNVNLKDYTIEQLKDVDICRLAGSVNGQQLVIQNCCNSMIFVLDHIDSINIDDCSNCKIVLGPVKGSVFMRDCSDCVLVVPCGQFRLRDCHHIDIFLMCATQPIIEESTCISFACIRIYYNQLRDHLKMAGLSVYNNLWYSVHDFTPSDDESNWKKLPSNARLQDFLTPPFPPQVRDVGWTVVGESTVIPISQGMMELNYEICLVLSFKSQGCEQNEGADAFLALLSDENDQCVLLTSRELHLEPSDVVAMQLSSDVLNQQSREESVVGLIIGGKQCLDASVSVVRKLQLEEQMIVYSARHAKSFLQCAFMHLGCE